MRSLLSLLLALAALGTGLRPAAAEDDAVAQVRRLMTEGRELAAAGTNDGEPAKVAAGVRKLREARKLLTRELGRTDLAEDLRDRLSGWLMDVESRLEWYAEAAGAQGGGAGDGEAPSEVQVPPRGEGETVGSWCRRVRTLWSATEDPRGRAALARALAIEGGVNALPTLQDLFDDEAAPAAREGIHEALAHVGTYRVARFLASYARRSREDAWDRALDVLYRCLEKPERGEPEEPFLRTARAFHELKERKLSLGMLRRLDAMGVEGIAALGEIVYVDDFGYQSHAIELLSRKRDGRAVPPLVHLMNRFKFDAGAKVPAHEALVAIGWYAVPALIDRLDDKAAGIWISYTLRKITGETMGTDKRKWHDWWKGEQLRHPELFPDPDERPDGGGPGPVVTGR